MNRLNTTRRTQVLAALVEGNSIRSTVRMTGVAKNTVVKLLVDVGAACARHHNEAMHNLPCKRLQVDEIWAFCYAKEKNVPPERRGQFGYGDVWTWTAICADTRLVPAWLVGARDTDSATEFLQDLAPRLKYRVQLTSDGHRAYLAAVPDAFGNDGIDYAMVRKLYGPPCGLSPTERRYSPAIVRACEKVVVAGTPDPDHVSTAYAEPENLTMRMGMRRFTRLTNGFSKKVENLAHAVALHFMYYNFCRIHRTLRVTPAMEAGIAKHVWEIEEIVDLL